MSSPRKVTEPDETFTRPNRVLSRVDLPAPFGPMMPMSSPSAKWKSHPLRMLTSGV